MDSMIRNAWVCLELECVKAMWNLSTWSKLGLKHSSFFSFTKERQSVSIKTISKQDLFDLFYMSPQCDECFAEYYEMMLINQK